MLTIINYEKIIEDLNAKIEKLKPAPVKKIKTDSYHFGADAHRAWADFLLANMVHRILTDK